MRPLRAIPSPPPLRPAVPPRPAVLRRPAGPRPAARLRLTARAHALLAAFLLAVGLALGSWLGSALSDGGGALRLAGVDSVVVQPGDTVWSIARSAAGDADVRDVVARIRQLNGLASVDLRPGQTLRLP